MASQRKRSSTEHALQSENYVKKSNTQLAKLDDRDKEECTQSEASILKTNNRHLCAQGLSELTRSIIDEIDLKRKNDETLITEFRKTFEIQSSLWCLMFQRTLSKIYEKNNDKYQEKLQRLSETLERINHLEQEMRAFRSSLKTLCAEVQTD